jgi:hypothetical protein
MLILLGLLMKTIHHIEDGPNPIFSLPADHLIVAGWRLSVFLRGNILRA